MTTNALAYFGLIIVANLKHIIMSNYNVDCVINGF